MKKDKIDNQVLKIFKDLKENEYLLIVNKDYMNIIDLDQLEIYASAYSIKMNNIIVSNFLNKDTKVIIIDRKKYEELFNEKRY